MNIYQLEGEDNTCERRRTLAISLEVCEGAATSARVSCSFDATLFLSIAALLCESLGGVDSYSKHENNTNSQNINRKRSSLNNGHF